MPLTAKGGDIMKAMQKQYGPDKGESVFYASRNKGTISGVDSMRSDCPQTKYMDACRRGDCAGMNAARAVMMRDRRR